MRRLLSLFHVLDPIAIQPALPYPSNDPSADNSEYTISSSFCRLWTILSGILSTYRDGSSLGATLAFAYTSFGKLLALASDLPVEMTRREHSPLTVVFFQYVSIFCWSHLLLSLVASFTTPRFWKLSAPLSTMDQLSEQNKDSTPLQRRKPFSQLLSNS